MRFPGVKVDDARRWLNTPKSDLRKAGWWLLYGE